MSSPDASPHTLPPLTTPQRNMYPLHNRLCALALALADQHYTPQGCSAMSSVHCMTCVQRKHRLRTSQPKSPLALAEVHSTYVL
jgi:hypothetical protein